MLARVVTLRFDPLLEAFDDAPLQELLKAREVFAIRDHFFVRNEVPDLAVPVTYGSQPRSAEPAPAIPLRSSIACEASAGCSHKLDLERTESNSSWRQAAPTSEESSPTTAPADSSADS